MKPPAFDYLRAESTQHALGTPTHAGENARVLAGDQSLVAMLNMRLVQPQLLVDISRAHDLNAVRVEDGYLKVSTTVAQGSVGWRPSPANEVSLLALVFPHISHFRIRNRGTMCSSTAYADPSAELPPVLIALDEQVMLRSLRRRRVMRATDFFQGMLIAVRGSNGLAKAVCFPLRQPDARYGSTEFSARHGDFALVAYAAIVTDDAIALAVGGVAGRSVLERWPRLQDKALTETIGDFSWKLGAQDDTHVSAQYHRYLMRQLGMRAVEEAR